MGLVDNWVARRMEKKSASFERWIAQQGTEFLPPDTNGWPVAEVSPAMQALISDGLGLPGDYATIYRSQPAVYTVVEFLAWQLSQVGIKVYERVSPTERHPYSNPALEELIEHPAPGLTYQRWMHRIVADLCIYGNNLTLKLEDAPGQGRSLVPIPFGTVTLRGGTLIQADTYEVRIGTGLPRTFRSDDVIHPRRYDPSDPRVGVSPLEPLRPILIEEHEASRYRAKFWAKSAKIDGIIERPRDAPWDDRARSRFREGWRTFARGGSREGEAGILEDGMQWKPASFSPRDNEFIASRKLTLETVARAYNIPLAVLSLTETATYASQKEFHQALYQDTLSPWTRMIEDELNATLVPWFTDNPNVYVEFTIEEKLRGSFAEQTEAARLSVGVPFESVNERRAKLNVPPIPDPRFDIPVMPANVIYGGAGTPGQAPMPENPEGENVVPMRSNS